MGDDPNLRADLRLQLQEGFTLASIDPGATPKGIGKKNSKSELKNELAEELFDLHDMLLAGGERALLLVLQGTDASGKSGTIKHVVRRVNPVGVRVAGFVEP
jgi:polyphosphate kinase 2 (PPK2 family)